MSAPFGRAALLTALLLSGAPGQADERKPAALGAPIEPLRNCPGGFVLPGSSGCVRLSGQVSVSTVVRPQRRALSLSGPSVVTHADGRVSADVRIPTEYGPLRAYTSIRLPETHPAR